MELGKAFLMVVLAICGVALLLFALERIESLIRSYLPKVSKLFFNSWVQLHAIAFVVFLVAGLVNWVHSPAPVSIEFLVVPVILATLVYAAPLAFVLIAAAHSPDIVLALVQAGCRSFRRRINRRRRV